MLFIFARVCVTVEALTFPPSAGKSFIMGADEALENELGLGELAGLTVANEAESLAYDVRVTVAVGNRRPRPVRSRH